MHVVYRCEYGVCKHVKVYKTKNHMCESKHTCMYISFLNESFLGPPSPPLPNPQKTFIFACQEMSVFANDT